MSFTIELIKVSKQFSPNKFAVQDVSLQIPFGSVICLIGSSGCGKTTTLRMINRLTEPTSGQILIEGQSALDQRPVQLRRKMGYVIQKVGLMPHLTVAENVGLLARVQGERSKNTKNRVYELLATVGLPPNEFSSRYPMELSGGQQQRVGIARALLMDPPILLMDEPFGALDPITRVSLQTEFLNLNQKLQKTIVMVTHDLTEAFKMANQIVLMDAGKIVQSGTKEDLLDQPKNDFVREFVEAQVVKR